MLDLIYIPGGNPKFRVNEANKLFYEHPYSKILITGHSAGLRNSKVTDAEQAYENLSSDIKKNPENITVINKGVDAYSNAVFAIEAIQKLNTENSNNFSVGVAVDKHYKDRLFKQLHRVMGPNKFQGIELIPEITPYQPSKIDVLKEKILDYTFERDYNGWLEKPEPGDVEGHLRALHENHIAYRENKETRSLFDLVCKTDQWLYNNSKSL